MSELKVRFDPVFGFWLPVAAVANITKHDVSLLSSARVTLVALLPTVDENESPPAPSETKASPFEDASVAGKDQI